MMHTNLDITLRYDTLCQVVFRHEYFKESEAKGISITPTVETSLWLRNNRIIYKPQNNGFMLGFLSKDAAQLTKKSQNKLSFLVTSTDPYFDTFTAYGLRKSNEIIYLTNTFERLELSKTTKITEADKIVCFPEAFIYKFSNFNDNKTITIKDNNSTTVWEAPQAEQISVRLNGQTPGIYHLMEGKKVIETFYLLPKMSKGLVAVVELFLGNINNPMTVPYQVNFSARSVIWQYYFVKYKESTIYEKMEIEMTKKGEEILFVPPQEVIIHTGQKAIMIASKAPIEIREYMNHRLQLKAFKQNTKERILIQLPNPTHKNITAEKGLEGLIAKMFLKI